MDKRKQYYCQRSGLYSDYLDLSYVQLRTYLYDVYKYALQAGWLDIAFKGFKEVNRYGELIAKVPPAMDPSPEVFFALNLGASDIWPLDESWDSLEEGELFTVIEILFDKVSEWDYEKHRPIHDRPRSIFAEQVNGLLKHYEDGYYLVPSTGFIMIQPNMALKEQLAFDGDSVPNDIYVKMQSAARNYYRYDADLESKRKAICSIADILESVREELKNLLNSELQISKNTHDRLIFDVVNSFNLRHENAAQKTDYDKSVWYDWMMQYYTSIVIVYYKIKAAHASSQKL